MEGALVFLFIELSVKDYVFAHCPRNNDRLLLHEGHRSAFENSPRVIRQFSQNGRKNPRFTAPDFPCNAIEFFWLNMEANVSEAWLFGLVGPITVEIIKDYFAVLNRYLMRFHFLVPTLQINSIPEFLLCFYLSVFFLAFCRFSLSTIPLHHFELFLIENVGKTVEGDLKFKEETDAADKIKKLESEIGKDLYG